MGDENDRIRRAQEEAKRRIEEQKRREREEELRRIQEEREREAARNKIQRKGWPKDERPDDDD